VILYEDEQRDERRIVASIVRLLMRLPRVARYGMLALALGGAAEFSGGLDSVLDALFRYDPVEVQRPTRSHRPDLRLERADREELDR
jgi:hypothetical protein